MQVFIGVFRLLREKSVSPLFTHAPRQGLAWRGAKYRVKVYGLFVGFVPA